MRRGGNGWGGGGLVPRLLLCLAVASFGSFAAALRCLCTWESGLTACVNNVCRLDSSILGPDEHPACAAFDLPGDRGPAYNCATAATPSNDSLKCTYIPSSASSGLTKCWCQGEDMCNQRLLGHGLVQSLGRQLASRKRARKKPTPRRREPPATTQPASTKKQQKEPVYPTSHSSSPTTSTSQALSSSTSSSLPPLTKADLVLFTTESPEPPSQESQSWSPSQSPSPALLQTLDSSSTLLPSSSHSSSSSSPPPPVRTRVVTSSAARCTSCFSSVGPRLLGIIASFVIINMIDVIL